LEAIERKAARDASAKLQFDETLLDESTKALKKMSLEQIG
jgi:hypothetical protein